jgi:hypothetical protein
MADRQREFLMAANHYRAGRITLDDFKQKALAATAAQCSVVLLTGPNVDSEDVQAAVAAIKEAGPKAATFELPDSGDVSKAESLRKGLKAAGAVVVLGQANLACISSVVKEAGCPVFVVPGENCNADDLSVLATELPPGVALLGKGQVAGAVKIAAGVARP